MAPWPIQNLIWVGPQITWILHVSKFTNSKRNKYYPNFYYFGSVIEQSLSAFTHKVYKNMNRITQDFSSDYCLLFTLHAQQFKAIILALLGVLK